MLLATPWPLTPRLTPVFLVSSFVVSILLLIYPKIYRLIHYPGLSIIILAIVLPTIPFDFPGYVPRHSIYCRKISLADSECLSEIILKK